MLRRAVVLAVIIGGVARVSAQAPTDSPAFEVASAKPNVNRTGARSARLASGSVVITNMPLVNIIASAYGIRPDRILDGPAWLDTDRFDINARAAADTPDDQLPLMLRTLLADRFKLAVRLETQEQPIYTLGVARDDGRLGPGMKPSAGCVKEAPDSGAGATFLSPELGQPLPCGMRLMADNRGGTVAAGEQTMSNLAGVLTGPADRPVIDRTGLTGTFDFILRFGPRTPRPDAGLDTVFPALSTAVHEQLGLKLEPDRGPVEVLLIDSVERPTPD